MIGEKREYDEIQKAIAEFPEVHLPSRGGTSLGVSEPGGFRVLHPGDHKHLHEACRDALEILLPSIKALAKANLERQLKAATEKAKDAAQAFIDETP